MPTVSGGRPAIRGRAGDQWGKGDGGGGAGASSRPRSGFLGTRQQYSRYSAAARRISDDPNATLAVIMSLRGVDASSSPGRYTINPADTPASSAATSELALASATIRATNSGGAG